MAQPHWSEAMRAAGPSAIAVDLHVEPGSSRPGLCGFDPWRRRLQLRVRARPREGAANREVAELLSEVLGVPAASVAVVAGATSRRKTVRVEGVTLETAKAALAPLMGEDGQGTSGPTGGGP